MKTTDLQKAAYEIHRAEYSLYQAACKIENVEPTLVDFLAGDYPDSVRDHMECAQNEGQAASAKALAASAGR